MDNKDLKGLKQLIIVNIVTTVVVVLFSMLWLISLMIN